MPQFHETRMGVRFFERDVPRIVEAFEGIASSLNDIAARLTELQIDQWDRDGVLDDEEKEFRARVEAGDPAALEVAGGDLREI